MTRNKLLIILLFVLSFIPTFSQTIEGLSGLLFVPTAEMQNDRQVTVGVNYIPQQNVHYENYNYNIYVPYITLIYLPFLEASLRISRLINYGGKYQAIGDRTVSIRVRFLEEKRYFPSLVVGSHDLLSVFGGEAAVHNNALYLVTSKHLNLNSVFNEIGFHIGYGVNWVNAANTNFVGLFGGIHFELFKTIELMTEYDGIYSNGGIRLKLFDHISLLGGLLRYKYFSCGAGYYFSL